MENKQETLEEVVNNFKKTDVYINEIKQEQEKSYSEEDMEIIEISSVDANYIPHYQTKEGQLLATKFNVEQFKNK
jgi:hypothetical protein